MPFRIGATGDARKVVCTKNLHHRYGQRLGRAQGKRLNENLPARLFPHKAQIGQLYNHLRAARRTIAAHAFDGYKQRPGLIIAQQLLPREFLFHRFIHPRLGLEYAIAYLRAGDEIEAQRLTLSPAPLAGPLKSSIRQVLTFVNLQHGR